MGKCTLVYPACPTASFELITFGPKPTFALHGDGGLTRAHTTRDCNNHSLLARFVHNPRSNQGILFPEYKRTGFTKLDASE